MIEGATLTTAGRLKSDLNISWGDSTTQLRVERWPFFDRQKQQQESLPLESEENTTIEAIELDDISEWLSEDLDQLQSLRSIPRQWESSGAEPPNSTAIGIASEVLVRLSQIDFRPDHIDPSTDEGVCISVRQGNRYADIECFNDGGIFAVASKDNGDSQVWEVEPDEIKNAVRKIQRFILQS